MDNHPHHLNGDPATKKPKLSFISASEIAADFGHHDPAVARINNGSFGSVLAAQRRLQLSYLSHPDAFYFNHLQPSILRSRHVVKDLINADDLGEISLVVNATTAAAAIVLPQATWGFSEAKFDRGDAVIVMLHCAYGAVKKSIEACVTRAGGHVN